MTKTTQRFEVQKAGRTYGVFKVTVTPGVGRQQELIEGGFFSRDAAMAARDQYAATATESK